jgi:hypothetical protein
MLVTMTQNELDYYVTPGPLTALSRVMADRLFQSPPDEISDVVRIVQNTLIHIFWADRYGLSLSPERRGGAQIRAAAAMFEHALRLDDKPLDLNRELAQRLVGNCRDFSVLTVAILRHLGVPSRARCGFGSYFLPDHYEDHWVAEYWNAEQSRWVMVDAQLDAFQRDALGIAFDPLDVPVGGPSTSGFVTGSEAWRLIREKKADPDTFGIFEFHGVGFIVGDMLREVAALNKVELLPWDCWGLMAEGDDLSEPSREPLDHVAETIRNGEIAALRSLYVTDERLHAGTTIQSYPNGPEPVTVTLADEPGWVAPRKH